MCCAVFFLFKQKTAYEMRISDWSSDVCSSDLGAVDISGGVRVGGAVNAISKDASATAMRIGAGASVPEIRVSGKIEATTGGKAAGDEIGRASCRERVCQYV